MTTTQIEEEVKNLKNGQEDGCLPSCRVLPLKLAYALDTFVQTVLELHGSFEPSSYNFERLPVPVI